MTFLNARAIIAAFALAAILAIAITAGSATAQQLQQPLQTQPNRTSINTTISTEGSQLDAQKIFESKSITVDSDVKTLVLTIPDNAGTDKAAWAGFLPSNATVVAGTNVVVLNADVNVTHTVRMSGANQSIETIPYQNSSAFLLEEPGQYTFTDRAAQINATVNVVKDDSVSEDPVTNENRTAVGLLIVPSSAKSHYEPHLNTLGFNAVSSFNFTGAEHPQVTGTTTAGTSGNATAGNEDMTLFVWTQQISHPHTLDGRLASKVRIAEDLIYPDGAVKQTNTMSNSTTPGG